MQALKQVKPIALFRDNIKNKKIDEVQQQTAALVGINFHTVSYTKKAGSGYIGSTIGSWSVGCQVANNIDQYYQLLNLVKNQKTVSYCLIKEFNTN
jgi:invasion protein IalB